MLILTTIHLSCFGQEKGSFTDARDGHVYKWVKIGSQIWMAENLAYLPEVSNVSLPFEIAQTIPKYFVYAYQGKDVIKAKKHENYIKYGVLYNWLAAKDACPEGWHLPSDSEWKILENKLGMPKDQIDEWFYRAGGNIGLVLKSKFEWSKEGNGLDRFGFSVLPGGFRHDGDHNDPKNNGGFSFLNEEAFFWSSTKYKKTTAFRRHFNANNNGIDRYPGTRSSGYCVRCIKN
ncbi:MAG: FISUMP domain-containing protein [Lachnospirales bacterium]